ncbi:MAG TPA: hypothetical protein VMR14_25210 [Streptosporangiaceae bacterium]|jgi:hypothetical protein|nr:hypothetical protein [Streptosporangiaceae bacterium]
MSRHRAAKSALRGRQVLAALAAARPDLDAGPQQRAAWPTADNLIEAAGRPSAAGPPDPIPAGPVRSPRPTWAGWLAASGRRKLIGALASAVLTAAVIVGAVAVGTSVTGGPGHARPSRPPITQNSFRPLQLLGPWRGRIGYEVRRGVVYLEGSASASGHGDPGPLAVLPRGVRPATAVTAPVVIGSAGAGAGAGAVQVSPDGQIRVVSVYNGAKPVSVDGVIFFIGP